MLILISSGAVYGWNHVTINGPLQTVLEEDSRNSGIEMHGHHKYYLVPSTLVIDIQGVGDRTSKADIFRVLLQYAAKLKDSSFDTVLLSNNGDVRFALDGKHFATIGAEYGTQNPIYTMRMFPSHLTYEDGREAYGEWTGGLLGVASKQMEDFGDFFDRWLTSN